MSITFLNVDKINEKRMRVKKNKSKQYIILQYNWLIDNNYMN